MNDKAWQMVVQMTDGVNRWEHVTRAIDLVTGLEIMEGMQICQRTLRWFMDPGNRRIVVSLAYLHLQLLPPGHCLPDTLEERSKCASRRALQDIETALNPAGEP